jgi:hypothetical protein
MLSLTKPRAALRARARAPLSKNEPAPRSISSVRINAAASLVVPFPVPQVAPRAKADGKRNAAPPTQPSLVVLHWVRGTSKQNLFANRTAGAFHQ